MIVRLEKEQQKPARHQLLADVVYIISQDALKQMQRDGHTELSPAEVVLSARNFCHEVLALPDIDEGLEYEIEDLEDEAEGENDAMLILVLATVQLQALNKKYANIDIRKIILQIFEHLDGHELMWPLIEKMTNKEDARWLEGKKTNLLDYELQEIKLDGGGLKEVKAFMNKYTQATLALTPDEIRSTLIVLGGLNLEYNHAFDKHIALLCDKLGIVPSEIHNHFEKESGCQVFNGPVSGQFDKK